MTDGVSPLRVVLEIDRAADPISGRVDRADGVGRRFRGWTALAAAIEWAIELPHGGEDEGDAHVADQD